ncbi:MAG: cupin domain-containing protein [Burkholderiales bacterium]
MVQNKVIEAQTIIQRENLTVIRLKIMPNSTLPEHSAPASVVITVIKGEGTFTLNGQARPITQGDIIYMQPNAPHSVTAADNDLELVVVKVQLKDIS